MEQYIETIADVMSRRRVASVSDIAAGANVSRPAASRAVRDLAARELVEHQAYGYVVLTPRGQAIARKLNARHKAIQRFLSAVLGYREPEADVEACRLEHLVDDNLVDRLEQLTRFFESEDPATDRWRTQLGRFLEGVR
jgi:DtxR family Mn-dependent transcriptional regulator